jgi:hypothetical protein
VFRTSTATATFIALSLAYSISVSGQASSTPSSASVPAGDVVGSVIDSSAGVLPGVTVTATTADGRILATTITDERGGFGFPGLPAAPVTFRFELEGFDPVTTTVAVEAGAESQVVERLDVAPLSEVVEVTGVAPPEPVSPPLPPPRKLPPLQPVHVHDRDSICGPAKPNAYTEALGTISSGLGALSEGLFTAGSEVVVDAGLDRGLDVGRNLVVRRRYRVPGEATEQAVREHSAGVVQIVESGPRSSIGVVVYACEELRTGDFVASFEPEPVREPAPPGLPDFSQAAKILFADEGQSLGSPRRLMVIGRGSNQGAVVGERLTLFRQGPGAPRRVVIGNAVVMSVREDSSTIRIDRITDAIAAGDWAAPHVSTSVDLSLR